MHDSKYKETKQQRHQEMRRGRGSEDLIVDTAAVYTCSFEVALDYTSQCQKHTEDFEDDLVFAKLARDLWKDRPGKGEKIAAALSDLIEARQEYLKAVTELTSRFEALMDPKNHEHLDPIEKYRERVHYGLFPDQPYKPV